MNDRLAKAEALFHEALELPPGQRDDFLQTACGGDAELCHEVAVLLRASGIADRWMKEADSAPIARGNGGRLSSPGFLASVGPRASERPGTVIGRYKLLEKIGEGGFGVVYMAQQQEPVRRKVALKVIKLGMDTRQVVARFEAERQALALMDHPNIAKVLDGGATESGRPYFVMELVRGIKVTDYCDQNNLSTTERLALFVQVCQAVEHAHQKGIIHRDLKPSNILVTGADHAGAGCPKIIDFGIAKATGEQRLTNKTLFTASDHFVGTPAYMSPEQAEMSRQGVDTRTDLYALGVLLYELLTGRTPFDTRELMAAGLDAVRRAIRETEPTRPSTRLGTMVEGELTAVARHRRTDPPKLIDGVRGDLDWIVMKCLEKDRTRRYETASALALDVQRHLRNEPVLARPPGNLYRLRKLIGRNKLTFAAMAAVSGALLLGVVGSGWQALRATRAERRQILLREQAERALAWAEANERKAQTEAVKSRHVAQFMKTVLHGVGPSVARGRDTTMLREILNRTAERLGDELKDEPAVEAELRHTVAQVYGALGEFDKAELMFRESLALRRTMRDTNSLEVAESLEGLAWALRYEGRLARAVPLLREALEIRTSLLGDTHPSIARTLYELALACSNYPGSDEVVALFHDALATRKRVFGEEHPDCALLLHGLGNVLQHQGKLDEAERLYRQALAMGRKLQGECDDVALALGSLCAVVTAQNRLPEAENLYRELLEMHRRLTGDNHPGVARVFQYQGWVMIRQHKWSEAENCYRQALAIGRKFYGDEHPEVVDSLDRLSQLARRLGKWSEAETAAREAVALRKRLIAKDQSRAHAEAVEPAVAPDEVRNFEVLYRRNLIARTDLSAKELALTGSLRMLAMALRGLGEWDEAKKVYLEAARSGDVDALDRTAWFLATCVEPTVQDADAAVRLAETAVSATQRKTATFLDTLAAAYAAAGRFSEAESAQQEAIALEAIPELKRGYQARLRLFQTKSPYLEHYRLAARLRDQGKPAEAESVYRQELTMRQRMFGDDHPTVAESLGDLAEVLHRQGQFVAAERLARECLSICEKHIPEKWLTFDARRLLGSNLLAQKRYADAEPLLRSACEGLKQRKESIPPAEQPRLAESVRALVPLCEAAGDLEKAGEWKLLLSAFDQEP